MSRSRSLTISCITATATSFPPCYTTLPHVLTHVLALQLLWNLCRRLAPLLLDRFFTFIFVSRPMSMASPGRRNSRTHNTRRGAQRVVQRLPLALVFSRYPGRACMRFPFSDHHIFFCCCSCSRWCQPPRIHHHPPPPPKRPLSALCGCSEARRCEPTGMVYCTCSHGAPRLQKPQMMRAGAEARIPTAVAAMAAPRTRC